MPETFTDSRTFFTKRIHKLATESAVSHELIDKMLVDRDAKTLFDKRVKIKASVKYQPHDCGSLQSTRLYPTVIVPGLLGDTVRALVTPFMCARKTLSLDGYRTSIAWTNGRRGSEANAHDLRKKILVLAESFKSEVHLIGYSKGCADLMTMLTLYPDTHACIKSIVSLAGVVHGTPLAKDTPRWINKFLQYAPVPGVPIGDGQAINDLRIQVRKQWLENYTTPAHIYGASLAAIPDPHRVSRILKPSWNKLSSISPHNDSQMVAADTLIPHSDILATLNADHWAVALPFHERSQWLTQTLIDKNKFPRTVLMRAIIDHLDWAGSLKDTKTDHCA